MLRRPPTSTLFPYTNALPIYLVAVDVHLGEEERQRGHGSVDVPSITARHVSRPLNAWDRRELEVVVRHHRADRKSTRLNSSHSQISYAVFCLKKKKTHNCDTY